MASVAAPPDELAIDANAAEIRRASEWVAARCDERSVPEACADKLLLCLNEVVANVILHGGPSARSFPIRVALQVGADRGGGQASVTVTDSGRAFDPTAVVPRERATSLDEATPGGRGLVMIERCSDWRRYRHADGKNHFTFGTRWSADAGHPTRFRRGPDRRAGDLARVPDRRHGERRTGAFDWIALFRDADPKALAAALADCDVLRLAPGTALLRRGESNGNVYILLSGRVVAQLSDGDEGDALIPIAPGECIGELSAIDGKPISAQVRAVSEARVLRLDRAVFWDRLMPLRGVARNMMSTLTERMRRTNEKSLALQRERLELEHLRRELEVARQLQASMLPLQRPLFPWRDDIEVCGFMEPASKVGGDLFDVFFVDNRTLFVCIGDVSGHGIAAALFMVRVIGLLRTLAMETTEPDRMLETLNDRLCIGNDTNLFVTLFCGFLDVQDGRFVYANGGHCVPFVRGREGVRRLQAPKGMLLGAASGRRYSSADATLASGETLLCYSDGLTEAQDPEGRELSEAGCVEFLHGARPEGLPGMLDALFERVVRHTGSRVLADDCTMLAVRRLAGSERA